MTSPEHTRLPVGDGALAALRWGPERPRTTVLALHGITATSMCWPAVAAALPDDVALVAPDLRGRGRSRDLPGPWGLDRHVADVVAIAPDLTRAGGELVLAGHSMGAYVAVLAAAAAGDSLDRLVLVDGGVPLAVPRGADPDELLAATLGPALERLRQTFPSVEAYLDFFRAHPALGPHWNQTVEDYVRYDALPVADGVRSTAVEDAVRADGRGLITDVDRIGDALDALTLPTHLLVAPAGMFGQPPGMLPADAVAAYDASVETLTTETVPDVNHYTILFDTSAAHRVAAAMAAPR